MIYKIKGKLIKREDNRVIIDVGGLSYEVSVPKTVSQKVSQNESDSVELVIYHYLNIDKNKASPILVGFVEDLEKDFFEKFITVSGVGPKAALRAFDRPVASIAKAIEEADLGFLRSLAGIGAQRAKQIVAHLQGKVGRFALIKDSTITAEPSKKEIVEEAKEVLRRLQYGAKEAEGMIKKALDNNPDLVSIEELLNEIYRQKK